MKTTTKTALSALDSMFDEIERIKGAMSASLIARPDKSVTAPELARRNGTSVCLARHRLEGMVRDGHLQRGLAIVTDPHGRAQKTVVYFPVKKKAA